MSGIDTSIYNALLQKPKSVAEYDAEATQGQQNRLMIQSGQAQLAAQQRGVERGNRLSSMLGGFAPGMSAADQGDALMRGGFIDEGRKVVESGAKVNKDQREAEKAQREAERFQFDQAREQISFVNQIIGSAKDQASYSQGRQAMAARGMDVSQIPERYDPAYVQSAGAQTMTHLQQLDQVWKERGFDLDMQKFGETVRSNKAGERTAAGNLAVAQGNLGVSRQREAREASAPKGQIIQSDSGPILVDPRTGVGRAITGADGQVLAGVTKPLNDSQSKALLFGTRMQEADKILGTLAGEGTTTSVPGSRTWGLGSVINALSPEKQQMLDQAKRDFVTATLRRESGAAISPGEFETADKQYFPQVGDGPRVLAQKARNRELAANGILAEVPEKQRASIRPKAAAPAPTPAAPAAAPTNAKGWSLHVDAKGNKAYVSPDGKQFEEVR